MRVISVKKDLGSRYNFLDVFSIYFCELLVFNATVSC